MIRANVTSALALACLVAGVVRAQEPIPRFAEYRVDAIAGRGTAVEAGAGAVVPMGVYVRVGVDAAAGVVWGGEADSQSSRARAAGRVDVITRFLLDPFREVPIGLSVGGGVSLPFIEGAKVLRTPYLAAVVDVEGRMHGPITPALQIGLGGGARVGIVLRTSPNRWR